MLSEKSSIWFPDLFFCIVTSPFIASFRLEHCSLCSIVSFRCQLTIIIEQIIPTFHATGAKLVCACTNDDILEVVVKVISSCFISTISISGGYCGIHFPLQVLRRALLWMSSTKNPSQPYTVKLTVDSVNSLQLLNFSNCLPNFRSELFSRRI